MTTESLDLELNMAGETLTHAVDRLREAEVALPTFAQLADPTTIPARVRVALRDIDPDAPHPLNLFRVHWHNDTSRRGITEASRRRSWSRSATGFP